MSNIILKNKILMITGGTGSFGSAVLHKFLHSDVKEIRIFSRDEKKQEDLRIHLSNPKIKFYIGDVREYGSINQALRDVDYVFHAAALKQVPSCEFYPMEAIRTNILGAENVMNAAIENNVKRVIVLSTDKAVYPINAMGMSKALMEKLMIAKSRMQPDGGTIFAGTRYGNVMASRGSVIPLFIDQVRRNKNLTITDGSMTRFLMSLEDSVELVMYAFENAQQGDLFIQKAPAATVLDLAKAVLEIMNSNLNIDLIGTRHGEKLFESLLSREEMAKAKDLGKYFVVPADQRDLNYNKYFIEGEEKISNFEDYTSHNTQRLGVDEIKILLSSLGIFKEEINA
jgi:UDP-glucose 4-epimerase